MSMARRAVGNRLHIIALALCGAELVLLCVRLLGWAPAAYPFCLLLLPTLVLVVLDSLRLRSSLSNRDGWSSRWWYCGNLLATFALICFGGWLQTCFRSDAPASEGTRSLPLLALGYLAEALVVLEVWLSVMLQMQRWTFHGIWFYVLGTVAVFLLFLLGEYALTRSVNWVIAMVQSLMLAEGWLLIHVLKWLLRPVRDTGG